MRRKDRGRAAALLVRIAVMGLAGAAGAFGQASFHWDYNYIGGSTVSGFWESRRYDTPRARRFRQIRPVR